MHIAICIWGILRSLSFTINSIQEMCLDPILSNGHTYEVFLHTYNFSGDYKSLRNNEKSVKLNFSEWKLLRPDHVFIENQDDFDRKVDFRSYMSKGDPWHNNFTSFRNHLRALNSLRQLARAVETVGQKTHFDGVVYMRPDVTYLNELPIYLLEQHPNTLFLSNFHRSCKGGEYNDRFAMGDYRTGLAYGKKFDAAQRYSQTKMLHSEKFTYDYIQQQKSVQVLEIPFRFRRIRASGDVHIRDQALYTPAEQYRMVQRNERPYHTSYFLRCVYGIMEAVTFGQMYVWNHDDDENQFCTPHEYLDYNQVQAARAKSLARAAATAPRPTTVTNNSSSGSSSGSGDRGGSGGMHYKHRPRPETKEVVISSSRPAVSMHRTKHNLADSGVGGLHHRHANYSRNGSFGGRVNGTTVRAASDGPHGRLRGGGGGGGGDGNTRKMKVETSAAANGGAHRAKPGSASAHSDAV